MLGKFYQAHGKDWVPEGESSITVDSFIKRVKKAGDKIAKPLLLWPTNTGDEHHGAAIGLYTTKSGGGLGILAGGLHKVGIPTLGLPTTDMPAFKPDEDPSKNPIAKKAVEDIWKAIGAGYDIVAPYREKYGETGHGFFPAVQKGQLEPSWWGKNNKIPNPVLAEYYLKELTEIKNFLDTPAKPVPAEYLEAYNEGQKAAARRLEIENQTILILQEAESEWDEIPDFYLTDKEKAKVSPTERQDRDEKLEQAKLEWAKNTQSKPKTPPPPALDILKALPSFDVKVIINGISTAIVSETLSKIYKASKPNLDGSVDYTHEKAPDGKLTHKDETPIKDEKGNTIERSSFTYPQNDASTAMAAHILIKLLKDNPDATVSCTNSGALKNLVDLGVKPDKLFVIKGKESFPYNNYPKQQQDSIGVDVINSTSPLSKF